MFAKFKLAGSVLAVIFAVAGASGQVSFPATGTPPFGSFGGGPFDIVNLGNLNTHFAIPVLHKAGRGTPFTYDLSYDTSVWAPVTSSGTTAWTPAPNWGWRGITEASTGYVAELTADGGSDGHGCDILIYSFVYHDTFGAPHNFWPTISTRIGGGTCHGPSLPLTLSATDGSGYSLNVTSLSPAGTITSRSAKVINAPFLTGSGAGNATDANGNQITVNSSGQFFDTLSSTTPVLTVSGTAPSPTTYTYIGPSGSVHYTMNYSTYSVKTSFHCSGVAEYTNASAYLVSSLDLPDGSAYTFTYELAGGFYTGRLKSVTLPSGGTITYTYSGGTNGIECADGSAATLTREVDPGGTGTAGTWTYARTLVSGNDWKTVITSPPDPTVGNVTTINFQKDSAPQSSNNFYETQRVVDQGGSTVLSTTITCYNAVGTPTASSCPTTTAVDSPINRATTFHCLPNCSGVQAETDADYLVVGGSLSTDLPTDVYDYDFGSGTVGGLLRHTVTAYAPLGNGIVDHPSSVKVYDSGSLKAQTTYSYDESTPTASGATQHVAITGSRGNLTTVAAITNISTGAALYRKFSYYDTGTINQAGDVSSSNALTNPTTYGYSTTGASCDFAFPVSITEPLSLSRSMTWTCNGGVMHTAVDENNQQTTYDYTDPYFWRLDEVTYPDGGATSWTYNTTSTPWNVVALTKVATGIDMGTETVFDGLGRVSQTEKLYDLSGDDTVEATYDALGRVATVTNPHRSGSSPTDGTTSYNYDALGRILKLTRPDGPFITKFYANRAVYVKDESGVQKVYQSDGLGRLQYVCDGINAAQQANLATIAPCNLDYPASGFLTTYGYDPMGNILSANVGAWGSGHPGQGGRTYTYDGLSRLLTESNPESGSVTYAYDASTAGDLSSRIYPKPSGTGTVTATYTWDALHRLANVSFGAGLLPYNYTYDVTSNWGHTLTNTKGRLVESEQGTGSTAQGAATYSYDPMGRIATTWSQCTGCTSGTHVLSYTYNLAGEPVNRYVGDGVYYFTNTYNALGQLTNVANSFVDSTHPATLLSSTTYNPLGELSQATSGDGIVRTVQYDKRGRPTSVRDAPTYYALDLGYTGNGSVNYYNDSTAGDWSFLYDAFNRLATSSNASTGAAYTYGYDQYGNRWHQDVTAGAGLTVDLNFDPTTNHITGGGVAYDPAGDLTNDGSGCSNPCWTYDVSGNLTSDSGGATFGYDGLGRRVNRTVGTATYDILLSPDGTPWDEYLGTVHSRVTGGFFTFSNNTTYFNKTDHEGTPRVTTDYTATVQRTETNLPFGDGFSETTSPFLDYAGYAGGMWNVGSLGWSNTDHFGARDYGKPQGRWLQPDPAGMASVDITNPQTWNRYAYVTNNPMSFIDPSGLNRAGPGQCNDGNGLCPDEGGGADPSTIDNGNGGTNFSAIGNSSSDCPICTGPYGSFGTAGIADGFLSAGRVWGFGSPSDDLSSVIFNYTKNSDGYIVGDYAGEVMCPMGFCIVWNPNTQQWDDGVGVIYAGPAGGKKAYCDHQSNMAAMEAILPGGSVFLGGDYSPTAVGEEAGQEALAEALDAGAKSTSFLLAVRSWTGLPMSVTSKVLTGFGYAMTAINLYSAMTAMQKEYAACIN
jgi:RHS repeat-associated protein